ncbi:hypothetical protein [Limnohabitans sp. Bal53]|uniref:hypothetical protein n=1 Tax=Limnohabitans sp. Bal53 TaxID=1977910 RepID=UPI0011B2012F|nr:hypothetical protein [Limnohabitans sp. Bal53]
MTSSFGSNKRRCLLIAPLSFYSFHKTVAAGLEQMGFVVETLNEEYPSNSFGKVLGKVALPLLRNLTLRSLQRLLNERPRFDLVMIIKGRGLGPDAIQYLKSRAERVVGYNFDSFRFNPSPLDWHHLTDRYCTFDIQDAQSWGLPLVHLFSAVTVPHNRERSYDLSIIQRVHSDRLAFAELILRALPDDARYFVFLYESSWLTFTLGLLRHPLLYVRLWQHISFKPLSHAKAMEILGSSRITFDYAHPLQSGVTIRCFESQSLGVAILTNNQDAVRSGLFSQDSIAYLPRDADRATASALISRLLEQRAEPRCRSLGDFLDDLLSPPSSSNK